MATSVTLEEEWSRTLLSVWSQPTEDQRGEGGGGGGQSQYHLCSADCSVKCECILIYNICGFSAWISETHDGRYFLFWMLEPVVRPFKLIKKKLKKKQQQQPSFTI